MAPRTGHGLMLALRSCRSHRPQHYGFSAIFLYAGLKKPVEDSVATTFR